MGTIPDRIFELIVLQLDHEQTADEEKELAAWLAEKKEHRQWWESYLQIRAQAKLLDRPFSADTEKALAKVKASRRFLRGSKKAIAWCCPGFAFVFGIMVAFAGNAWGGKSVIQRGGPSRKRKSYFKNSCSAAHSPGWRNRYADYYRKWYED